MDSNIVKLGYHDTYAAMSMLFKAKLATIIYSSPGQGKTSMIKQYAEDQGPEYGLFELNASLANLPDFQGWFYRVEEHYTDYDGNDVTVQAGRYSFPYFLFDKRSGRPIFQFKKGALVIEEYGQADIDLKKSLGQTSLERRVGQYQMPDGIDIVMLSNYAGGRDAVGRDFDFLINRRGELHYQLGVDDFLVFAHARGMLNMTMAFASIANHKVFDGVAPKDQGPFLTPRSLESLDRLVQEAIDSKTKMDDPLLRVSAAGIVGSGAAHQYIAFAKLRDKIPTIKQIVDDPDGTKVPSETDQCMFLVFSMADKAEKANIKPLVKYLARMPSDFAVAFYRNALLRDKSLMACREFGDWCVANKSLLAIVNSRA
jgi:hypothetical protein